MAKNRVIIKIVTLIAILTYLLLGGPLVVLGNTTEEKVTNNVTNSEINTVSNSETNTVTNNVTNSEINTVSNSETNTVTNSVTNSVEINKDKEPITISIRNGSLRETVLGICRSYGISVIGVESLKGNITATVKGESPEEVIKELGRIYHFSVSKQHNTLLIESEEATLENRELYVLSPEHLPAESLKAVMGTVVKNDKMAVLSEQNEVIMHLTSGEKRRIETLVRAIDKEPKQVQLEDNHHCYGTILCKRARL